MRRVGRYVMYDVIASGGMGSVHIGRLLGLAGFSRTVAIKRMHPHLAAEPQFVTMFLDEARLAARVVHPNVVAMLDVVAEEGEVLLVMEYVRGASLAKLRSRSMPLEVASAILVGVLDGLHAAHGAADADGRPLSIVHRDVSPQNVLVGADGVPRVLDFGIAKALGRLHTTREGDVKGKAGYMSPEQICSQPVDHRSDIFAAGVVLWELVAGARLFDSDSPLASMMRIVDETPPPLEDVRPDVPAGLAAVVARALARAPSERFATALEMSQAISRAVPPARPAEVAAWFETAAPASLDEETVLVESIGAREIPSASATGTMVGTTESAVVERHPPAAPGRVRRAKQVAAMATLLGASAAVALVGALRLSRGAGTAAPVASIEATAPSSSVARIAEPAPSESEGAPVASSTIRGDAPNMSAAPAPVRALAPAQPRPVHGGAARRAKPTCDPPFTWSADGRTRLPKPECF
jgi:eukaryotic-like serine/threonine-protein kinase